MLTPNCLVQKLTKPLSDLQSSKDVSVAVIPFFSVVIRGCLRTICVLTQSNKSSSDMAEFNKPKWQLPLVFEMKNRCSEKHVLSYVLTVDVTTVEWESRLQKSITIYTKNSIHLAKNLKVCSWAKLVRILISEGSLSLLKILGTKSLAEMFTRIPCIESLLALCLVGAACFVTQPQVNPDSTIAQGRHIVVLGLRGELLGANPIPHRIWVYVFVPRAVWHEPEQFSSELNNISLV
ncbi:hypothetical protein Tco_1106097 [Tanacetum coccineum]